MPPKHHPVSASRQDQDSKPWLSRLNFRDYRRPVAFFANGHGDTVLCLPALRALSEIFSGALCLIHSAGSHTFLFNELNLVRHVELSLSNGADNQPTFDHVAMATEIRSADLFMSLVPWISQSLRAATEGVAALKVGYFECYDVVLPLDRSIHTADSMFKLPKLFGSPEFDNYAYPIRFPADAEEFGASIRRALPRHKRILSVHLDTLTVKMWESSVVSSILNRFLTERSEFVALIVGKAEPVLELGAVEERVVRCYGLALEESFVIVASSDLFMGVDSCMLHVADICRVPGVALFGPTNPKEFGFRFSSGAAIRNSLNEQDNVESVVQAMHAQSASV